MAISAIGSAAQPRIMSGASSRQMPQQKMTALYHKIDTQGAGSISKDQFKQAFSTLNPPKVFADKGADHIFKQLDPQNSGSVAKDNFVSGMKSLMVSLRASKDGMDKLG